MSSDESPEIGKKGSAEGKPYIFTLTADADAWTKHLREEGYVVLSRVLSEADVTTAKGLLTKDLNAAANCFGAKKGYSSTHGILPWLAQTAAPWFVRGHANVQQAFSSIWNNESSLITSMDSVIVWRTDQFIYTEGFHLDQSPVLKPYLDCVQGMVPLLPVTEKTGGLAVIPKSHTEESRKRLCEDPELDCEVDFVLIDEDAVHTQGRARLLECDPGDLILWDSRTIHGGVIGTTVNVSCDTGEDPPAIIRAAIPVAMTPRSWASTDVQASRREGFHEGESFNHCPHEAGTSSGTLYSLKPKECAAVALNEQQEAVL